MRGFKLFINQPPSASLPRVVDAGVAVGFYAMILETVFGHEDRGVHLLHCIVQLKQNVPSATNRSWD